ncbi:kinase-like protein [Macrolepiota fuliginosa MF-IS2]|uniref:Kinase-like protein n=1 Tax=Macrolepiota fuliginosa MF-IS2 TaxID=1400762 RepID=A0A9P6C3I8_9AGAR|nr:kinase-like protein [Macrolepiota fuliginosa MF-IS2]
MLCKLATSARVYPSHFVLKDVTYEDRYATKGGFASVHKGLYRKMNVCIKLIENQTDISACIKELILWAHLLHPNILPFHGVYQVSGDSNICLISPWMDNGTLCEYSNKLTPASRLPLISDVIDGLLYLHELNIVHSDLKGANVLVSDQGRALITDFGISHIATATAGQKCTSSLIGATARWAPPEAFDREGPIRPTKPQDVWSFGCLCYEVLSRKPPFHQYQRDYQLIAALIRKETPLRPEPGHEDWDEINDLVWALMETRWRCSPEDRLDIQSIHGHFAKLDFQDDRPELSRSSRKGLTQDGSINFDQVARILSEAPLSGCGNTSSAASEK